MLRRCSRAVALALALAAAGCAGLTPREEERLGAELHWQLLHENALLGDEVVGHYVDSIGRAILQAAPDDEFPYRFFVLVSDDTNAFAGPGGYVYVHTGTILRSRNVAELAAVLAHEVGHVERRHIAANVGRRRTVGLAQQVGVVAAGVAAGPAAASAVSLLGGAASLAALNSFGRGAEREADAFAVEILPRAGYDPEGLVTFFQTLEREKGASPPAFLSSHPTTEARVAETRRLVDALPDREHLRRDDGGRLEIIQERIRLLTGAVDPAAAP
jgi:predicted Zn-dependent protease